MSLENVKNFFPIVNPAMTGKAGIITSAGGSNSKQRNLSNNILPISLQLITRDLKDWRDAEQQAIDAYFPYRTKMQHMFHDTVKNEHISTCMERRKDLTLTRKFEIRNANGERDKHWTEYFEKTWFKQKCLSWLCDAGFYGYNLIALGDITDGVFTRPNIIKRWNISPDRRLVLPIEDVPTGWSWDDPKYSDWHIWIDTISDDGISSCGYGLLYNVAKTEILLRNNLAYNTDFIEMYAQPLRVLKTSKTEGAERDQAEEALRSLGSAGYMLIDLMDEIELIDGSGKGNAYKSYNDFEHRLEQKASKHLLGHADAVDSVPGKLGSGQLTNSGAPNQDHMANSPVGKALRDKQTKDATFIEPIVTEQFIPKLRRHGLDLPKGSSFHFLNDAEDRAIQDEKNNTNQKFATFVMTLAQGGVRVKKKQIAEATGLPEDAFEEVDIQNTAPNPAKEPKDQIESGKPFKEEGKKRDGKQ
jgi:hypothetical protein